MAHKFSNNVDLSKKEIQNARAHNLASAPSSPALGQFYFDTTQNKGFEWDGTIWVPRGVEETAASIKTKYESNSDTNAFTDSEKTKLAGIESGAEVNDTASQVATKYESNSDTNKFTDAEKSKLAGLESSKYLGTYANLSALQTAQPSPDIGSYADVDGGVGSEVSRYIWDDDDAEYVVQGGSGTAETAASIKTKYESNADTNAFTDAEKTKVANSTEKVTATITGDNSTTSFAITHNLNTLDVIVQMREGATNDQVVPDVTHNTVNQVTVIFGTAPANAVEYKVVIIG